MNRYKITGGKPVCGKIKVSGNKNAALPCIAAALLSRELVTLHNLPDIEDVHVMLNIFRALGGTAEKIKGEGGGWKLCAASVKTSTIPEVEAEKIRASILFAGPLLARSGSAVLPPPGGDVIGRRRLDTHILALAELGAHLQIDKSAKLYKFSAKKLIGADIFLDEASVTATENAICTAVLSRGTTIISNAASEPHCQDLCGMLTLMGARIEGCGSNRLVIEGVEALHGCDFTIGADYMEAGSFLGLAAATRGEITIEGVLPRDLRPAIIPFKKLGIVWEHNGNVVFLSKEQSLKVNNDIGGMIPKIDDSPWPGFPPDLTSIITVLATQVEGTVLVHEKMFESRMYFVDMLIGMGARIVLCDPHRAVISGPAKLSASVLTSPDVRAGMAMVIAALCAEGTSLIRNVYQIERGYENIVERLRPLGAVIEKC